VLLISFILRVYTAFVSDVRRSTCGFIEVVMTDGLKTESIGDCVNMPSTSRDAYVSIMGRYFYF